jgi:hypothetical protein
MVSITPSFSLTNKFIRGLKNYNLTYEEIKNSGWKYCGGNQCRHLNYFRLVFKNDELPDEVDNCVCGHYITENCYITDGIRLLVLGNCCIKKFIPKNTRTCSNCENPHKNRKVNKCNKCRVGFCDICNKKCNTKYKQCYSCHINKVS